MIIKNLFPAIPAAEPKSEVGGPFLDSWSLERCFRRKDVFQVVLF